MGAARPQGLVLEVPKAPGRVDQNVGGVEGNGHSVDAEVAGHEIGGDVGTAQAGEIERPAPAACLREDHPCGAANAIKRVVETSQAIRSPPCQAKGVPVDDEVEVERLPLQERVAHGAADQPDGRGLS